MSKHTELSSHTPSAPQLKPLVRSILAWAHRPATWTLALGAMPALALAQMPSGGKVVAGSATITAPDANHTVIQQGSDRAVVNWQSFSIGNQGYVQFVQPGRGSVTLNRVVGADPSAILGHLTANGQIFLVNPNGIFFGNSAVVDVAGIVATTLDIKNEDFMRGDYRFSRSTNASANATVINQGTLNANGGYVVLAGDYAANKGIVQAQLGTVLLASGDALTLQMAGSSLINYQVDKATVAHLAGVENSGQILANGGRVIMTADVANDLASTVVNNSGLIQAQSTVEKNGAVYFEGQGGNIANSGTIDASAQVGANGGHVEIHSTGDITHEAGSRINVSGADTGTSNAGSVNTWADGTNNYKEGANIIARGGAEGGNGGQVELSGNKVVNRSIVDLRAPKGKLGTLTLDPNAITIADGAGADAGDQSTIYEQNLEAQLRVGNVSLTANGPDASITVAQLSDGALDGTNNGTGGSLSLTASGTGTPAIAFANTGNTIKVDGGITMATDNGAGSNAAGTINVGNLEAGTAINLKGGSITTGKLTVEKTISTSTDTSYNIDAHAYAGDLTVNGDVKLDVTNSTAAALSSSVSLQSDTGNVTVDGNVTSNATGLGYYNYNWTTAGNAATSYYGAQPWTLISQGDHPISADLNIHAAGNVTTGGINVLATDTNTAFDGSIGGYWQTATPTVHNFWRPTGATANAAVTADSGNVTIGGKASVIADGYAVSDYSEVESWRTMVDNFNYSSANQTVHTDYGCLSMSDGACTGGYGYRSSYVYTDNRMKGSSKGNYIWEFGEYTYSLPSSSNDSPTTYTRTDSSNSTGGTAMSYSGVRGMSATLNISAGGSVSMNGMEVRSTNHSATGSASYTDGNWGHQDTAAGLNGTPASFTSAQREIDYDDEFSTSYTAGTTTATASITAGDNASVTMNGGSSYDVIAEHPRMAASVDNLAGATMSVTAGSVGGATGGGTITIENGINVIGAKNADVSLTIRNFDGDINTAGAPAIVTNGYDGADARASIQSDNGNVHLDSIAVSGGRSAYLDVNATGTLAIDNASSATATGPNSVGAANINLNGGSDVAVGDVIASSTHMLNTRTNQDIWGSDQSIDGGTAAITVQSAGGDIQLNGDVKASGYKTATVNATASGAGKTLATTSGKTVSATTSGQTFFADTNHSLSMPTYSAGVTLSSDGSMTADSSVAATVTNGNGAATVALTTTGGPAAAITQGADSLIKADGSTGTLTINAGASSPDASTAAAIDLNGGIAAQGSTGAGTVTVNTASGSVHDLGAASGSNTASVTLNTLDANGTLVVDGSGAITANANSLTGAAFNINGAGSVDSSAATVTVSNINTGISAGARASMNANNGTQQVGSISVTGYNNGLVNASSSGDMSAVGAVSATATAASGQAKATLNSTAGNIGIAGSTGSVSATASGNLGTADVKLTGATGATLDGNATATAIANGTANLAVTTTGGSSATVEQGANSTLLANGMYGNVKINAGDAEPDAANAAALDMHGDVQARSTNGAATIAINGKSGEVHDFSAISTGGMASADITALNGALDLTGTGTTNGYNVSTLTASATGDLSTREALGASLSAPMATAQVNLTSSNGTLLVDDNATVNATGTGSQGKADINLTAANGMTVNGNLTATSSFNDATVELTTTGGTAATLTQGANSTILADGDHGAVTLNAGNATPNAANAAALALAGDIQARAHAGTADITINGASGTVHDFSAESTGNAATIGITSLAPNGTLALNGIGSVSANQDSNTAAHLTVTGAGSLDSSTAALSVNNTNAGPSAGAQADLNADNGNNTLGNISITSDNASMLNASASGNVNATQTLASTANAVSGYAQVTLTANGTTSVASSGVVNATAGNTDGTAGISLSGAQGVAVHSNVNATANGGNANIDVLAAGGNIAFDGNLTALASDDAEIDVHALGGALTQSAGKTVRSGATDGTARINLASSGAMTVNGDIVSAATSDGTVNGTHTGNALVNLNTTGGAAAGITQANAGTIEGIGRAARVTIVAGDSNPGDNISRTAAFNLNGTLKAIDSIGGSQLQVGGSSGTVHDFTVTAGNTPATAVITTFNGNLTLNGTGTVTSAYNNANGASLRAEAAGSLDTSAATLNVSNTGTGSSAGAQAILLANGGSAKLGQTTVSAQGDGEAALLAMAATTMTVSRNLSAGNLGLGDGNGKATISLSTTGSGNTLSTITQNAGTTISATTGGNAGNATVDIQAGNCCNSAVALNGTVKSIVTGGTGDATVGVRGSTVTVKDVTANVVSNGSGNAMLNIGAPTEIKLNGAIEVKAANAAKRADIELVSNRLTDNATSIKLSTGNGHVQLASFNTNNIIGVNSASDFDATVQTNYSLNTLYKFIGQQAEITFGGEYDRSAWTQGSPETACVPGMASWSSQLQQTGAIHVAGNGKVNLGDVKMVFDTTGTTYYHDPKMSAWSVPEGRLAVLVMPPSNVDRYLDRTDNTVQNMNKVVEESFNTSRPSSVTGTGEPVPGARQISGKLFMNGDGVNMAQNGAGGSQTGAATTSAPQGNKTEGEQNSENDKRKSEL